MDERDVNPDKHSVDLNDYRIYLREYDVTRMIERLTRPTALDFAQRMERAHTERWERLAQNISGLDRTVERITDLARAPLASVERMHENLAKLQSPLAFVAAVDVANRSLNSSLQNWTRAVNMLAENRVDDLLRRATQLATSPGVEALLRRADELVAAGEPEDALEELEGAAPEDVPDLPQMQWVFELDRETLLFLSKYLFHLTAVLSPALGVAVALSDRRIDVEDLSTLLAALNVLLAYLLLALKSDDEDGN